MVLFRSMGARPDAVRGTVPVEVRKALGALFTGPGLLPGGSTPLVTGRSDWSYTVGTKNWVTSRGPSDGLHLWGNDGNVAVGTGGPGTTVPASPGSGLSRIDIVYALHPAAGENGDTTSEPTVAVAVGVAASSPVAPSIPPGALELARNVMTSSATSTASAGNSISNTANLTYLRGTQDVVLARSTTLTTNGSGRAVLTFPTPFETISSFVATPGDVVNNPGTITAVGFAPGGGSSRSSVTVEVRTPAGALVTSAAFRINYIAVGTVL